MAEPTPPAKKSLKQRLGFSNKSSAPRKRLTKKTAGGDNAFDRRHSEPAVHDRWTDPTPIPHDVAPEHAQRTWSVDGYNPKDPDHWVKANRQLHKDVIDRQTGERTDLTEMLHALRYDDNSLDSIPEHGTKEVGTIDPSRPRGEPMLTKLSAEIWVEITEYLRPREAANLALTCKTALWLLGTRPFDNLRLPTNRQERIDFLLAMDVEMPGQLFCFPCAAFHIRTHPGHETLKPAGVLNLLFDCPNKTNSALAPPRHRITCGRVLPFTFVQLVTRAFRFGQEYGLPAESLSRRWRDPWSDWTHQTRFYVHKNGHLLMRAVSHVFAEGGLTIAAKRMLLYSREDYTPYFSVCAHWKDGILMDNCKCALGHIPVPKQRTAYLGGAKMPGPSIVALCGNCQPMRRCPQCPSEYLIELKLIEDKNVARNDVLRFKQALIVTRWCDLGNGMDPHQREWAAIQGDTDGYDSFTEIGNRSVSSTFENAFSDTFPFQRLLSMNPSNEKKGDAGTKWY